MLILGKKCEECKDLKCENNGICSVKDSISQCQCPTGFQGLRCQNKDCKNTCQHVCSIETSISNLTLLKQN